ncbi:MAG: protoporphyrinogen oxidase [Gammaproteobacteria bacterium]
MKIAIVGAGISGLSTAFYIKRERPDWELVIFDPGQRPGGTMETVAVDGFLFEAGGNGFLTNKPASMQLVEDSGAKELLLPSSDLARKRFIYTDSLHRLPESGSLFLKSKLITLPQKLRVAGEFFVPKRREESEETLQQFGYRRVGKGFTDVFLDAMVAGIYAATPDKISVNAAFPLVVNLEKEYGGLFRGMLAKRKKEAGPGGILMSFKRGVSTFIDHLHTTIDADWRMADGVTTIERNGPGYLVHSASGSTAVDRVVVAAQPYAAAGMLDRIDPELSTGLDAIGYSPTAVVGLGFKHLAHPLDGFGLLTTTAAKQPILGVLWDSSIFPDRASGGGKALRVMLGGQRSPEMLELDDDTLIARAREGVANTMGVDAEPDAVCLRRWPRGIPSYPIGHIAHVDRLFDRLRQSPGLYLNCNAYRGIAMNDCVRNSRDLAERIVAQAHD